MWKKLTNLLEKMFLCDICSKHLQLHPKKLLHFSFNNPLN